MGLDMYLNRRSYVKNWDHMTPDQRHEITVKRGGNTREDIKPERISHIVEEVAYWRKANQIHAWFIKHCGGGNDDCREMYVERKQLAELVGLCKQVLGTVETVPDQLHNGTTYTSDPVTGAMVKTENYEPGQVLAQKELAAKLLPTQSGFFFGNTDYDEWYLDDLKNTVEMLEPLLADEKDEADYYYEASW